MYSRSNVPVDRALGFDFSGIADLAKSAATVGLNLYQNQMQVKQIQAIQKAGVAGGYVQPSPGVYGQVYGQLPLSQVLAPQPTFGTMPYAAQQGMSTTTILMLGAAVVGGLVMLKKVLQ